MEDSNRDSRCFPLCLPFLLQIIFSNNLLYGDDSFFNHRVFIVWFQEFLSSCPYESVYVSIGSLVPKNNFSPKSRKAFGFTLAMKRRHGVLEIGEGCHKHAERMLDRDH